MPGDAKGIDKATLFARLAEGHAAAITVVTPNNRLAQSLRAEFDAFQINRNLSVWEDADILPVDAFAARCHENAIYADEGAKHPLLLSESQAQALWESIVRASDLLAVEENAAETAAECVKAWKLAHQWRIDGLLSSEPTHGNDDTRAFARWAAEYRRRCDKEGWTDAARLPERRRGLFEKQPKLLVAYGFDVIPEQIKWFLSGFDFVLSGQDARKSNPIRTLYPSSRAELDAAARWARGRIERGARRVGLVVPRLEGRRREVLRAFARAGVPVDVSLGEPLAGYPIVDFALSLIGFSLEEKAFEELSRLIRSPFLGGANEELAARARLDARLRRRIGHRVSLARVIGEASGDLRVLLEKIFLLGKEKQNKSQSAHAWAEHFTAVLAAAGFPGERALDTAEYQTRTKFNEVLGDFAKLDLVVQKVEGGKALRKLKNLCDSTLFQPERAAAPVQALGILESAGLEFDALWVSGLTEEAWPVKTHPNPFLPLGAQQKAGIPQSSAEASLALDRRITGGWACAAAEVVFSAYLKEEDRELLPSTLIAGVPAGMPEIPEVPTWGDLIFSSGRIETVNDEKAPPISSTVVAGGTRVLADQAACPFRAFARYRLGARELEAPAQGLDARGRGSLLHALMAAIWKELKSSEGLKGDVSKAISNGAKQAVEELELQGEFAALERTRLEKLAREWLEIERRREPFEVLQIEQEKQLEVGGLSFQGRVDRIDRLVQGEMRGAHVIIDYKTGNRATPEDWMGKRPEEPQLPIYAVSAAEPIGAVAYARLKTGRMRFAGFSRAKGAIPEVNAAKSWTGLLAGWKNEIHRLAGQFGQGDARIDPRSLARTCRTCGLQPLCRVHERFSFPDAAEDAE